MRCVFMRNKSIGTPPVKTIEENIIFILGAKATGRWSEFLQDSLQQTQVEVCHGRQKGGVFVGWLGRAWRCGNFSP